MLVLLVLIGIIGIAIGIVIKIVHGKMQELD